jgi:FSR family fosmidomycin resistance protein-like MFS transporter
VTQVVIDRPNAGTTLFALLGAISFCHFLNDLAQSVVPAIYPMLKSGFGLTFGQIGLLGLVWQGTASLLQPIVGHYTDRRPRPYSLAFGMCCTLLGMLAFAFAPNFATLLGAGALLGLGSAIFHPESSRFARAVSGGAHGLAQSLFQVGGNVGSSAGPLLAAFLILPHGQESLVWVAAMSLAGIAILAALGRWYEKNGHARPQSRSSAARANALPAGKVRSAMAVLMALLFSKFFYLTSITTYYIFYLMHAFHLPIETAQIYLFVFLAASAVGTFIGGPIGDRVGRKTVIWGSILGVLPFSLALPYVGLAATVALSIIIALVLSSAFSAIVVYGQELMPGRVGMVSGLFFGIAFGLGGIGAAVLGEVADWTSIEFVYRVCAFLPAIGLLAAFLPNIDTGYKTAPAS